MFDGLSLRARLTLLVAGSVVPLAVLAGTTTYFLSQANDAAASVRLQQLSRSLLGTVEARLGAIIGAAQVLSVSEELARDDLPGFRHRAEGFLGTFLAHSNLVLSDRHGMQRINTAAADPYTPRPTANAAAKEAQAQVFRTGKPVVSNLFVGQIVSRPAISVTVPVMREGRPVYSLGIPIAAERLSALLVEQQVEADWTVAIWDSAGTVIARNRDAERYVGQTASPSILPALMEKRDQVLTTVTFEGVRVMTAISYSSDLGLSLAVGVPEAAIAGPTRRALTLISLFAVGCLALSSLAAARLATGLLRADRHRELLIKELNHRVKNTLAILQGLVRQTFRNTPAAAEHLADLDNRIMALGRAHAALTAHDWQSATIGNVASHALAPFMNARGGIAVAGDKDARVTARSALAITLALNELATNATKYGALSVPEGRVKLTWQVEGARLKLTWSESGGPQVREPERKGFGSALIERGLADDLEGAAKIEYRPEGVVCTMQCPIERT